MILFSWRSIQFSFESSSICLRISRQCSRSIYILLFDFIITININQDKLSAMNIFYFVNRWPRYNRSAKANKILSNIETLLNIGNQVSLFSSDSSPQESLDDISKMPIEVLHVNPNKISQSLTGSANKPDIILFNSVQMEQMYSIFLYSKWNKCPRILQLDRLQGLQKWRQSNYTVNPSFIHQYDCPLYPTQKSQEFSQDELSSILRSDYYLCSTDFISEYIKRTLKLNNYVLSSIGMPITQFVTEIKDLQFRQFRHRKHFAFIGNLNSEKNLIMIDLLIKQIWPLIRKELKDVQLHIYGSGYNKALQGKKKELQKNGIFLKGFLQQQDGLQSYRAMLYPLQYSCGTKGAISEAWFHHTPVVTTPIGAQGCFLETSEPRFSALQTGECYSGFFKERIFSKQEELQEKKVKQYYNSNKLSQKIKQFTFGGLCDSFSCADFAANAIKIYTKEQIWKQCLLNSRKSLLKNQSELQLEVNLGFGLSQVDLASYEVRKKKQYKDQWNRYLKSKEAYNRLHQKKNR